MLLIPELLLVYLTAFLCIICISNAGASLKNLHKNPAKITSELGACAKVAVDSKAQPQSLP